MRRLAGRPMGLALLGVLGVVVGYGVGAANSAALPAFGGIAAQILGWLPADSAIVRTIDSIALVPGWLADSLLPVGSRLLDNGQAVPCLLGSYGCVAASDAPPPALIENLTTAWSHPGGIIVTIGMVAAIVYVRARLRHSRAR